MVENKQQNNFLKCLIKCLSYGFAVNEFDSCIYSKPDAHGAIIICLCVDDMLTLE